MKFRKKPVVVEAIMVKEVVSNATNNWKALPEWIKAAYEKGDLLLLSDGIIAIGTREGQMTGSIDDWIIRGVQGELYPCKPDIFAVTYEAE